MSLAASVWVGLGHDSYTHCHENVMKIKSELYPVLLTDLEYFLLMIKKFENTMDQISSNMQRHLD